MNAPSPPAPVSLATVCRHFRLPGRYVEGQPYGNGHINDTFAVVFDQAGFRTRYIVQRINRQVFTNVPALMENIARVSRHLGARAVGSRAQDRRRALTLIPTSGEKSYHQDASGACWRAFHFIEGASTHDLIQSPRQAYEAALAFGQFQRDLADFPGPPLHETIPGFHDTRHRFRRLEQSIAADLAGRAAHAAGEISFARAQVEIAGVLPGLQSRGEIPVRVTHNDTKLNNVMMDNETGRGICVIDLDTVMPGLALYDFGDMVRSAANAAAEDEADLSRVRVQLPMFEALVEGYLKGTEGLLNEAEIAHLAFSARLITLEIGIRFLTDYLEGDTYFKTRRPHHNLDRCRCQFALVRSMEASWDQMRRMVDCFAR